MKYKYKFADGAPLKLRLEPWPCMNNTEKAIGKISGAKNATLDI